MKFSKEMRRVKMINVTPSKFAEITTSSQVQNFENGRISKTVFHDAVEYVITGLTGTGTGKGTGWAKAEGYTIKDIPTWYQSQFFQNKLAIEPLPYRDHHQAINAGLRERSYRGMSVFFQNRHIVLLEKIVFICSEKEPEQLTMF